ncbi:hypothetical protein, partial [Mycobacterium tuberculosis]|uniref:hypothetical protein n=1 Tax=Mycobacterium tuberculosis TaxID=1773 RepID=UPI00186AEF39
PEITPQEAWEVVLLPEAQAILDGVSARLGGDALADSVQCDLGRCVLSLRDGDVLLTASLTSPTLDAEDADRVRSALTDLIVAASASARPVELASSEIFGLACEGLLTDAEVSAQLGMHVEALDRSQLGGWGIPAEVYYVRGGAQYCLYAEGPELYSDEMLLTVNTLP